MDEENLLRFVDVGALGGVSAKLRSHASMIWPILFEPNQGEAEKLKVGLEQFSRYTIVDIALAHRDGDATINVARNPTCSSLLSPNFDLLGNYGISYHFEVQGDEVIKARRYDSLFYSLEVPCPDVIKIDVQGFEAQVLHGFGFLLHNTIAIKLEAHFYEVYRGQSLLGDVISYLSQYGFVLRKIESDKTEHFAGDLVEIDAYFSKDRRFLRAANQTVMEKYMLIQKIWDLPIYDFELP